jgi:carbonic anhydrase/acetyltransferase-like protein (isoleucine patch superfamily)
MPVYEFKGMIPVLGRDVLVTDNASVIGDVELADEASVWFGAVLRGDYHSIRVGPRSNLQDNAVVHITSGTAKTTIGADVTVGHGAIIHGAFIGDACLVGMGSIVLDGAVVGEGSFVAAGSLITPGTAIPPRSFVMGRPAKVIRPVTDDVLLSIHQSAANYVTYAREFRATCKRIDV